jgi:phage N-6-adenine-methyltransferase
MVSEMTPHLIEPGKQELLFGQSVAVNYNAPVDPARRVMLASGSEHWCTPPEVLDVVRQFGPIIFDPFSNPYSLVGAERAVEVEENSLSMHWPTEGLIFWNPPYGDALADVACKVAEQAKRGCTMIGLVPARMDTAWWQETLNPQIWCAWRGRITFLEPVDSLKARHFERTKKAIAAGQRPPKEPRFELVGDKGLARGETATFAAAFIFMGRRWERFAEIFGRYGKVYEDMGYSDVEIKTASDVGQMRLVE